MQTHELAGILIETRSGAHHWVDKSSKMGCVIRLIVRQYINYLSNYEHKAVFDHAIKKRKISCITRANNRRVMLLDRIKKI